MGEYVKKVVPYSFQDTDAVEAWLEQLAQEGLVLERDGFLGLVFQRCEPTKLRFRIDSTRSFQLEKNKRRREQLAKKGWQYAGFQGGVTIYKNIDLNQKELPEREEDSGPSLQQNGLFQLVIALLCLCTLLLLYKVTVPKDVSPTFYWLTDGFWDGLGLVIFLSYFILLFVVERVRTHRLQQRKRDGSFEERSYHTPLRARRNGRLALMGLSVSLLLIVVPNMDTYLYDGEFYSTQEYPQVLPVPPLSELVRAENQGRQAAGMAQWLEEPRLSRSEVFEERYPLLQKLTIYQETAQNPKGSNTLYYPRYYTLRYEGLAERLYQDLQNERAYQPLPTSNGVQVSYSQERSQRDGSNQALLLHHGTAVLEVSYGGELDLSKYVAIFVDYLTAADKTKVSTDARLQAEPTA